MKNFFKYLEKNCIRKKRLGKYTPIFNYYANIRGPEFDIKYVFLTNNITENINKFLNSSFKKAYPFFEEWRGAIFKLLDLFENKTNEMKRYNSSSKSLIYYVKNINIKPKILIYQL